MTFVSSAAHAWVLLLIICSARCDGTEEVTKEMSSGPDSDTTTLTYHPYCSPPQYINGNEGQVTDGFKLIHVHVVLTPGETFLPMILQDMHPPPVTCKPRPGSVTSTDKLNTLEDVLNMYKIVQHDRQGFKHMFPDLRQDCGYNDLTSAGIRQLVSLGEHLYHSYRLHQAKLSPSQIHVESSTVSSSAYSSTLAFLHGFLPEKMFAKTIVHKALENLCHPQKSNVQSCFCSKSEELRPFVVQALDRGRYMFKDEVPHKESINEMFDRKFTENSATELIEALMLFHCNENTSFCFHSNNCLALSHHSISVLVNTASQFLKELFRDRTFTQYTYLNTYPFLNRLFSQLSHHKFMNIYTVERQVLQLLHRSLDLKPQVIPLASRLTIEMHRSGNSMTEGVLYVRVLSNGRDVTGEVINCDQHLHLGLCPLSVFQHWLKHIQSIYQQEC